MRGTVFIGADSPSSNEIAKFSYTDYTSKWIPERLKGLKRDGESPATKQAPLHIDGLKKHLQWIDSLFREAAVPSAGPNPIREFTWTLPTHQTLDGIVSSHLRFGFNDPEISSETIYRPNCSLKRRNGCPGVESCPGTPLRLQMDLPSSWNRK